MQNVYSLVVALTLVLSSCTQTSDTSSTSSSSNSDVFYASYGYQMASDDTYVYAVYGAFYVKYNNGGRANKWALLRSSDQGQTWSVVDYELYDDYDFSSWASVVHVLPSGTVVLGGTREANIGFKTSNDSGATWTTHDPFTYDGERASGTVRDLTHDSASNLYWTGNGQKLKEIVDNKAINANHWLTRKSTDNGVTWTTVDDFFRDSDVTNSEGKGVAVDSSDNVYVTGYDYKQTGNAQTWFVRKSTDSGSTWTSVDSYQHTDGSGLCSPEDIEINSADEIFVTGRCVSQTEWVLWITRKSSDGGTTWTTVDSYQLTDGRAANATGMAIDSSNNIYVTGIASSATLEWDRGITRKSSDGGTTWTTVDDWEIATSNPGEGPLSDIFVDGSGNVYTSARVMDPDFTLGGHDWVMRVSQDGGSTWTQTFKYSYFDILETLEN